MTIALDENALQLRLEPLLDAPSFRAGIANLASDRFFLAFFLMSVSEGEGLGEAAVGMIRQDELAQRIHDLRRQEDEERGHREGTRHAADLSVREVVRMMSRYADPTRYRAEIETASAAAAH